MKVLRFQAHLQWIIPTIIAFAVLFSIYNSFDVYENIIVVDSDKTLEDVRKDLYKSGLYQNKISYIFAQKFFDNEKVKAGAYAVSAGGPFSLDKQLNNPDFINLNIDAGLREEELISVIAESMDWDNKEILKFATLLNQSKYKSASIIPGEYLFAVNSGAEQVFENISDTFIIELQKINKENLYQNVVLASIIEKESQDQSEYGFIASVYKNRLALDEFLNSEKALSYGKGDDLIWWPIVSEEDKAISNPFNTFLNKDLPPVPISNFNVEILNIINENPVVDCIEYYRDSNNNLHCED